MTKRTRHSADFKAHVALDAIRDELTLPSGQRSMVCICYRQMFVHKHREATKLRKITDSAFGEGEHTNG